MKPLILFLLSTILLPLSVNAACVRISSDLSFGARNQSVIQVQQYLYPKYLKVTPTGYYGVSTVEAVKRFQLDNNIRPVNGRLGPLTRAKLQSLSCTTTVTTPPTTGYCNQAPRLCPDGVTLIVGRGASCIYDACPSTTGSTICPTDVQVCPNGTTVSRTGPNCTFASCSTTPNTSTTKTCRDGSTVSIYQTCFQTCTNGARIPESSSCTTTSTTKTCLDGTTVSTYDTCLKTCPTGLRIAESMTCPTTGGSVGTGVVTTVPPGGAKTCADCIELDRPTCGANRVGFDNCWLHWAQNGGMPPIMFSYIQYYTPWNKVLSFKIAKATHPGGINATNHNSDAFFLVQYSAEPSDPLSFISTVDVMANNGDYWAPKDAKNCIFLISAGSQAATPGNYCDMKKIVEADSSNEYYYLNVRPVYTTSTTEKNIYKVQPAPADPTGKLCPTIRPDTNERSCISSIVF